MFRVGILDAPSHCLDVPGRNKAMLGWNQVVTISG